MRDGQGFFLNREEAAEQLAERLAGYRGAHPLILAVPRGAVLMGRIIAEALDGDLDVVLVRKLGAPGQPEFAIGAVSESGEVLLQPYAQELGVSEGYIAGETAAQLARLHERRRSYTPSAAPIDPAGRTVIVVDDGVATGSTLKAALRAVRLSGPKKLVAAMGVAPPSTLAELRREADEVVCLSTPSPFRAVGEFFADFSAVSDEEVIQTLREARRPVARDSSAKAQLPVVDDGPQRRGLVAD